MNFWEDFSISLCRLCQCVNEYIYKMAKYALVVCPVLAFRPGGFPNQFINVNMLRTGKLIVGD